MLELADDKVKLGTVLHTSISTLTLRPKSWSLPRRRHRSAWRCCCCCWARPSSSAWPTGGRRPAPTRARPPRASSCWAPEVGEAAGRRRLPSAGPEPAAPAEPGVPPGGPAGPVGAGPGAPARVGLARTAGEEEAGAGLRKLTGIDGGLSWIDNVNY